jgi:hypothetical protein
VNFRWDISLIQSLPECMKVVFNTILELWDEYKTTILESGQLSLLLDYVKEDVGFPNSKLNYHCYFSSFN